MQTLRVITCSGIPQSSKRVGHEWPQKLPEIQIWESFLQNVHLWPPCPPVAQPLTPADPCMTFDPSNTLHFGQGFYQFWQPKAFLRQLDLWMTFDHWWGHFELYSQKLRALPPTPKPSFSSVPRSMTKCISRHIPIQTPQISNLSTLTYLNVSSNKTCLMTFDLIKPTCIMFPLQQGKSTQHTNPIRLCVKKNMNTTKCICTKSLTDWHTGSLTHRLTHRACSHKVLNGRPTKCVSTSMSREVNEIYWVGNSGFFFFFFGPKIEENN